MAKQKKFKLVHHEPFVFEGDKGEHTIPPLEQLTYDDWKEVAELSAKDVDTKKMLDSYKRFFLAVCPDLADEDIGDNQWLQFGAVYFETMGE